MTDFKEGDEIWSIGCFVVNSTIGFNEDGSMYHQYPTAISPEHREPIENTEWFYKTRSEAVASLKKVVSEIDD